MLLPLLDLLRVLELFFESLLEFELHDYRVLLQIEQALNLCIHSFILIFEAYKIRQALHEEVDTIAESLLQFLVMADEGQHFLTEISSCMGGKVDASANFVCPVYRPIIDNLDECVHERVKWVRTIHVVIRRQLALEWDVTCRQLLQPGNDLSWLLVPYFELVHFEMLPGIYLRQLLLFFEDRGLAELAGGACAWRAYALAFG